MVNLDLRVWALPASNNSASRPVAERSPSLFLLFVLFSSSSNSLPFALLLLQKEKNEKKKKKEIYTLRLSITRSLKKYWSFLLKMFYFFRTYIH